MGFVLDILKTFRKFDEKATNIIYDILNPEKCVIEKKC